MAALFTRNAGSGWARLGASVSAMELITDRFLLRKPLDEDAADVLAMMADPEVMQWNPAPAVIDAESARDWCARSADWSDGTHATWNAIDRSTRRLVANCSVFTIDRQHGTARIGYRVVPWQRGHGVASEVARAVTRWSFAELGLVRIQLEHATANVASCRVAARAGFVLEGILRSAYLDGLGVRHDDHVHGRLATDPD
jgi:RimJ/RimL family protein N-acetyltransferase